MPADRLSPGLSRKVTFMVTPEMSPPHLDGILSTSRMIGLIEDTCLAVVQPLLEEGQTTVGTRVDITHVGTAWADEEVAIHVRLEKVTQRRLLTFQVEVTVPNGIISTGSHQRLVIVRSRFATAAPPRPASTR